MYTHMPESDYSSFFNGDHRALAKAISMVEDGDSRVEALLTSVYSKTGRAIVIGVTGHPGTGKSTLVDGMIGEYRKMGKSVGVLAIDPSSPFTGGALLGDRIRMIRHSLDSDVFIRSMASRDGSGGLARATRKTISLLDASGKDVVIIETVGAGQSEVDVIRVSDTVVVVTMPGLGDEIQTSKAGLLEIGHIFVVNKSDLDGADKMVVQLMNNVKERDGWRPPIITSSFKKSRGLGELMEALSLREQHLSRYRNSNLRKYQITKEILELIGIRLGQIAESRINQTPDFQELIDKAFRKEIDPEQVADIISSKLSENL